jgi:hypothetical protein
MMTEWEPPSDGDHRPHVTVRLLYPPFDKDVVFFDFKNDQTMAVSKEDGKAIKDLFHGKFDGRSITLERRDDYVIVTVAR